MRILVCIKQILSKEGPLVINPSGTPCIPGPSPLYQLNAYDEFALEESLRIKEKVPGAAVDVLSVGPGRVESVLRRGLGMGADHGLHLFTEGESPAGPVRISSWIAACARDRSYDLILTGFMAEDDLEGQVGPMTAERLDWPCITSVISIRLFPEEARAEVEKEIEGGVRERWQVVLPTVLTIQSGINNPRYPSLSNVLRARKQSLEVHPVTSFPAAEPERSVVHYTYPEKNRAGLDLSGTSREKAERLTSILREKGFLV